MRLIERLLHPSRGRDTALLVLRLGFGFMFVLHGWPKLTGGPERWASIGANMANIGLDFGHTFFGLLAALAELGGGLALMCGFLVRPVSAALVFTMVVATLRHLVAGDRFSAISHPIEAGLVWLFFLLGGAGAYSLDAWLLARSQRENGRARE